MPSGAKRSGTIRIGISGWTYGPWRGRFYPKNLPHRSELTYAAQRFRSIEINGTFYRLQRPEHFERWYDETPTDFVFAVKGPRYVTHMLKLKGAQPALANFFASGVLRLESKLGPILWQFPETVRFDEAKFDSFLGLLPRDTVGALKLARRHDRRVEGRAWLKTGSARPIRHAIEIRNETFCTGRFLQLLRRHHVALVCADTVKWPLKMDLTTDFVYCRLHGSKQLYVSGYADAELNRWAQRVRAWARGKEPRDAKRIGPVTKPVPRGRDVFVYFDNDAKVRAPRDAAALAARLSEGVPSSG